MVERLSTCNAGDPGFKPQVGKIPWRRKWQPTPVLLPGESHGRRSLVGYHGVAKSGTRLSDFTFFLSFIILYRCFKPLKLYASVVISTSMISSGKMVKVFIFVWRDRSRKGNML